MFSLIKLLLAVLLCLVFVSSLPKAASSAINVAHYPSSPLAPGQPWDEDGDGIVGRAGQDYPNFSKVPSTSFACKGLLPGFYGDPEAGCQVYHVCAGGLKTSFLCNNGTIFNQKYFTCDWWYQVACEESPNFYKLNELLYKDSSKPLKSKQAALPPPSPSSSNSPKSVAVLLGQYPTEASRPMAIVSPPRRPQLPATEPSEGEDHVPHFKILKAKAQYQDSRTAAAAGGRRQVLSTTQAYEEEETVLGEGDEEQDFELPAEGTEVPKEAGMAGDDDQGDYYSTHDEYEPTGQQPNHSGQQQKDEIQSNPTLNQSQSPKDHQQKSPQSPALPSPPQQGPFRPIPMHPVYPISHRHRYVPGAVGRSNLATSAAGASLPTRIG